MSFRNTHPGMLETKSPLPNRPAYIYMLRAISQKGQYRYIKHPPLQLDGGAGVHSLVSEQLTDHVTSPVLKTRPSSQEYCLVSPTSPVVELVTEAPLMSGGALHCIAETWQIYLYANLEAVSLLSFYCFRDGITGYVNKMY